MVPLSYNVRSLAQRRGTTAMTAGGISLVVTTLFVLLGLLGGLRHTIRSAANRGNWAVLGRGLTSEPASYIPHEQYEILRFRPEIAVDSGGKPLLTREIIASINVAPNRRKTQFTFLRGAEPIAYEVHRHMRLVSGRWPAVGAREWAIGDRLAVKYPSLALGTVHHYGRSNWTAVGIFSDQGSSRESEIWTDFDALTADAHVQNPGAANAIHLTLKPGRASDFRRALANDQRLPLDLMTEDALYADQTTLSSQLSQLALMVAILMAIAAIFGGMNTMYAAVARRSREIGILRAVGFTRGAVLGSFIAESAMLGLAGGIVGEVLGVIAAYGTGLQSRMMNVGMFIFSFRLSAATFAAGLAAAIAIGVAGGFMPALRAARTTIIQSIREA